MDEPESKASEHFAGNALLCPFCQYDAGVGSLCTECGHTIPADGSDRLMLRLGIRSERIFWLIAFFGLILSAAVFWLQAELMNSIMESYYPGSNPMRGTIYRMQAMIMVLPWLGGAYVAWRMRGDVIARRVKLFERKKKQTSAWSVTVIFIALAAWFLPAFAVLAILNAMG